MYRHLGLYTMYRVRVLELAIAEVAHLLALGLGDELLEVGHGDLGPAAPLLVGGVNVLDADSGADPLQVQLLQGNNN
jgi:hypothetical protein